MQPRALTTSVLVVIGCNGGDATDPPRPIDAGVSIVDAAELPPVDASDVDAPPVPIDAADVDAAPVPIDAADVDAAPPPPVDAPPLPLDAGTTCGRPPLGELAGFALMRHGSGANSSTVRADVRWVLTSSAACLDRYHPTGTVFDIATFSGGDPETHSTALGPGDGELVLDRANALVTYEMRGMSSWTVGGVAGGEWANARGTFDGDVLSGGYDEDDGDAVLWELVRVDATFPSGEPACAEPPVDHLWGTGFVASGTEATITWTRVSTTGCTDRFTPSGVAAAPTQNASCTSIVTTPPSAPIQPTDGELLLDRTRRPLRVQFRGETEWQGTRTCTHPDGTVSTWTGAVGGPWGGPYGGIYKAAYDGITFSGATTHDRLDYAWSLTRLPPAAASSPAR